MPRCPTCGQHPRRSNDQNARYWALMEAIADGYWPDGDRFSPESWHVWLKRRFLGRDDVILPGSKLWPRVKSSSRLGVDEFNDYMMNCEAFAAQHGVYLEE